MMKKNYKISFLTKTVPASSLLLAMSILQSNVALANIVGSDSQNFNPALESRDYVTVQSAQTLGQGRFSLGLFINHANNTLPYFDDPNNYGHSDTSQAYNDALTSSNLMVSYGILNNWDIGIDLPFVIYQHVESGDYHGEFSRRGNTGVRVATKLKILSAGPVSLAASGSAYFDRTEHDPYQENNKASYAAELIPEINFGIATVAANIGYRWRQPQTNATSDTPVQETENQMIASTAIKVPLTKATSITGEIYGARTLGEFSDRSDRKPTNSEYNAGIRQELATNLIAQVGLGREIQHSLSSADLRAFAGIRWDIDLPKAPKPAPKVVAVPKPEPTKSPQGPDEVMVIGDVVFDFNSAEIVHSVARKELAKVAQAINGPHGLEKLVIEGHTCSLGSTSYNLKLSERRARAVMNYLAEQFNVPREKMTYRGLGKAFPIAPNDTEENRKKNRRVEFKIYHQIAANKPNF